MTKSLSNQEYDLEERTARFSEDIIDFVKTIKINIINRNIIDQLIRAATSIGANYCEANASSSKQDLEIKFTFVKKKRMKLNTGLEYWQNASLS